ncbi:DNA polymerase iota [Lachnellula occidentalis]|uniref:DNA polymerase iota n=1 Tax=Lachnellula occidentalis TaxID=215460 RepID=A0A8H8S7P4_9HELO|nr:DNA polymerase iota [Lachnellula occidentalis]
MTVMRNDQRIIIHFDYDCFYASVFENENPSLKALPLKQIIVTCNYEARRRGLRKLQLIHEAKKTCPDVVIVLGEELGRFRDASKSLYKFLESFTWSGKVERLGFDEVFLDVTDLVEYNQALLNYHDLSHSFFQLKREDPTIGFSFNAAEIAGHTFPEDPPDPPDPNNPSHPQDSLPRSCTAVPKYDINDSLRLRLTLGSHLAQHLRWSMDEEKGYTSTVGISTNKLLSKLAGNLHKPKAQTTLIPPYEILTDDYNEKIGRESNVNLFLDSHDIGKIPGIGFKMSHSIRNHVLSGPAQFDEGLIYGGTKEQVTVRDVRLFPNMGPELLETLLGGAGAERGIGGKAWNLINGIDDTEVRQMKRVPTQISIEDSYMRLDTLPEVMKELRMLATNLIKRMHTDLLEDDEDPDAVGLGAKRWLAHPKTLRLTTRPRPPLNADGTRTRTFNRISRSGPVPNFMFTLKESVDAIVEKLIQVALIPMFKRLHPQQAGWNLSLLNVAVTNMVEAASEGKGGGGRDIGRMFKRQEEVLKVWRVEDRDVPPDTVSYEDEPDGDNAPVDDAVLAEPSAGSEAPDPMTAGSEDMMIPTQNTVDENGVWEEDEEDEGNMEVCHECGSVMPAFAMAAHERYHALEN